MTPEETVRWTVENSKVPVIAATERDVKAGAMFSIVTSEKEIGREVGIITLKILAGTPVSEIPIHASAKGKLVINAKTADKYKVDIPFDILSTAETVFE